MLSVNWTCRVHAGLFIWTMQPGVSVILIFHVKSINVGLTHSREMRKEGFVRLVHADEEFVTWVAHLRYPDMQRAVFLKLPVTGCRIALLTVRDGLDDDFHMRILVVDQECMGLDFVLRCVAAEHDVRWYRYSPKPIRDGEGMGLKIVDDWRDSMPWAKDGLIWCSGNFRFLHELDRYREHGFRIFAPTVASARLEIDRGAGMEAMKAAGIDVPPFHEFDSISAAEKFARKSDRAWVFKPLGDEADKSLTYVANDPADLVGFLGRQIASGKQLKGKCMLQEKLDMLCEIGVSGWFGQDGFLQDKWQICFEHKKLMDGEVGPATGEMGTITQYCETDKLANEMLLPLAPALQALGHRGDFAVGAGIDRQGKAWPFEFTSRAGWPAFFIQCASHRGDPAAWMAALLDGKDTLRVSYDVAIGVVLAQPRHPYNASPPELVEGNPISGIEEVYDDFHCASVMLGKGPKMEGDTVVDGPVYMTTGELVGCATALGKKIERARTKVYRTIERINYPNMMFRRDIGEKVTDSLPLLHRFGYALDMEA